MNTSHLIRSAAAGSSAVLLTAALALTGCAATTPATPAAAPESRESSLLAACADEVVSYVNVTWEQARAGCLARAVTALWPAAPSGRPADRIEELLDGDG